MPLIKSAFLCISCLLAALQITGCRGALPADSSYGVAENRRSSYLTALNEKVILFFFRHANFSGGGRTHILKIDDKTIGPLTADNYYRLEMWPGEYHFSVALPKEEFFGQVSLPDNISRQIMLKRKPSGNIYACSYTDGMGSSGFSLSPTTAFPTPIADRTLAKVIDARATAQITHLFGARYDGPALHGQPHGRGTLTWPDGGLYRGLFEYGDPTENSRFFFPNGHIFMGPNHKGRPTGMGVLLAADGRILFSGGFVKEKPDGVGLRSGAEGPEYCLYNEGIDITKTLRQLAKESLDIEDGQQIHSLSNRVNKITSEITLLQSQLINIPEFEDSREIGSALEKKQNKINVLEKEKKHLELNMESAIGSLIERLRRTRYKREIGKAKTLHKLHQAKIDRERKWCRDKFNQGHNLCICAPFADNFDEWQECREPLRKRYLN